MALTNEVGIQIGIVIVLFIIMNIVYYKYIKQCDIDIKQLFFNALLLFLSMYGSNYLTSEVLPSLGILSLTNEMSGGVQAFINEPSF